VLCMQMVLIMGAKLQKIICELTLEVRGCVKAVDTPVRLFKNTQVECNNAHAHNGQTYHCTPVRLRDDLFWFKRPRVMLYLIHFVLFQVIYQSPDSCYDIKHTVCKQVRDVRFFQVRNASQMLQD